MPNGWEWQLALTLISIVVSGLAGWATGKLRGVMQERDRKSRETTEERDRTRAMLRLLTYYRLRDLHRLHCGRQVSLSGAEKHEIQELFEQYCALGGNGEGARMFKELMNLDTT